jgi:hypothetical protein
MIIGESLIFKNRGGILFSHKFKISIRLIQKFNKKFFISLVLTISIPTYADEVTLARIKCVQFGFKENTKDQEDCVAHYLRSTGVAKEVVKSNANTAAQSTTLTSAQPSEDQKEQQCRKGYQQNQSRPKGDYDRGLVPSGHLLGRD